MDAKLTQALDNLHQHLKVRNPTSQQEIIQAEQEEEIYRPSQPDPSARDQQDLMSLPFFSLWKSKRTRPIEYK